MKKYIIGVLSCMVVVLLMGASVDRRNIEPNTHKVFRIEATRLTVADGGHATESTTNQVINGVIRQIAVKVNDNTGNATVTLALRDEEGAVLWTEAGIAENATTVFQYNTRSGTDLPMAIYCTGSITLGATASGDPGASTQTTDVTLWGD